MAMRVELRAENETAYAHYSTFSVASEENHYSLQLSGFTGTAGGDGKHLGHCWETAARPHSPPGAFGRRFHPKRIKITPKKKNFGSCWLSVEVTGR